MPIMVTVKVHSLAGEAVQNHPVTASQSPGSGWEFSTARFVLAGSLRVKRVGPCGSGIIHIFVPLPIDSFVSRQ